MGSPAIVLFGMGLWLGVTLLLSELRWFKRVPLYTRLRPFSEASGFDHSRGLSSFNEALASWIARAGNELAGLFGTSNDVPARLRRAGMSDDVSAFRLRQFGWCAAGLGVALLISVGGSPPLPLAILLMVGAPLLAFLVLEQLIISAASERQRRLFTELPVMSEQLAMLLGAGYSLGSALNRLADRGAGQISSDLRLVCDRIRQGIGTTAALREWSDLMAVPELDRLVSVLALSSETSDLGRLVSEEAKSIRQESQRRLVELLDKRAQQVWIPVTVATLVPGVIFLCIPFIQALRLFSET